MKLDLGSAWFTQVKPAHAEQAAHYTAWFHSPLFAMPGARKRRSRGDHRRPAGSHSGTRFLYPPPPLHLPAAATNYPLPSSASGGLRTPQTAHTVPPAPRCAHSPSHPPKGTIPPHAASHCPIGGPTRESRRLRGVCPHGDRFTHDGDRSTHRGE